MHVASINTAQLCARSPKFGVHLSEETGGGSSQVTWPGRCLRVAPGLDKMGKRTASVGPPKNLEKILSSKYGRYKDHGRQANDWGT